MKAIVLGANQKKVGYFEANGYQVPYAFGHVVTITEPAEMNPVWGGPWKIEQLPMIPTEWKYRVAEKAKVFISSFGKVELAWLGITVEFKKVGALSI